MKCEADTRNGPCLLDEGHRGQHRISGVWICDGCGRTRHGNPAATSPDGEYPEGMWFCLVCVKTHNDDPAGCTHNEP